MKLYVIRHGETDWNVEGRLQGRTNIPLNEKGRELARITARRLQDVKFTRIYTSPLDRARETAMIIKGDREIPVIEEERLQEISFGIYEGYHCLKDKYDIPDPAFSYFFSKPEAYVAPERAESIEELCKRATSFYQELIQDEALQNEVILISTHGAALRGFLASVYEHSIADFWKGGVYKNCAVTIVDVTNRKASILEEAKIFYNN